MSTTINIAAIHWADGASPEQVTEPPESLKDDGYFTPTAGQPGCIPTAAHTNWIYQQLCDGITWLHGRAIRSYSTLGEGLENTEVGEIFTVFSDKKIGEAVTTIVPAPTWGGLYCWAGDGQHIYLGRHSGADSVMAYTCSSGTLDWSAIHDLIPAAICSDGGSVILVGHNSSSGDATLIQYATDDGTEIDTLDISSYVTDISADCVAANGRYAIIGGADADGYPSATVVSYTASGTLTYVGQLPLNAHDTATAYSVCIGDTYGVVVGSDDTGPSRYIIGIINLSDATEIDKVDAVAWSASDDYAQYAVCTDTTTIRTGGPGMDPDGGGTYVHDIWWGPSLELTKWNTPVIIDSVSHGAHGVVPERMACDDTYYMWAYTDTLPDRYGVVVDSKNNNNIHVLPSISGTCHSFGRDSLDGLYCWVYDGTSPGSITSYRVHTEPRIYMHADPSDTSRRLVGKLAQPIR
jgi:hypothetical protein